MAESTRTAPGINVRGPDGWTLIGTGNHANVWCNAEEAMVRKTFAGIDRVQAALLAEQEFAALSKAGEALRPIPGVRTPIPHSIDRDTGQILMEYCSGSPIHDVIEHRRFANSDAIERLAAVLGDAIIELSGSLRLEDLDFSIRNILVTEDLDEIVLIDFASRAERLPPTPNMTALEFSLAGFLAGVAIYQIHRKSAIHLTRTRRLRQLTRKMLEHISAREHVEVQVIREIAWNLFWRQSGDRGWVRYLWFHTVGRLLFSVQISRLLAGDLQRETVANE